MGKPKTLRSPPCDARPIPPPHLQPSGASLARIPNKRGTPHPPDCPLFLSTLYRLDPGTAQYHPTNRDPSARSRDALPPHLQRLPHRKCSHSRRSPRYRHAAGTESHQRRSSRLHLPLPIGSSTVRTASSPISTRNSAFLRSITHPAPPQVSDQNARNFPFSVRTGWKPTSCAPCQSGNPRTHSVAHRPPSSAAVVSRTQTHSTGCAVAVIAFADGLDALHPLVHQPCRLDHVDRRQYSNPFIVSSASTAPGSSASAPPSATHRSPARPRRSDSRCGRGCTRRPSRECMLYL